MQTTSPSDFDDRSPPAMAPSPGAGRSSWCADQRDPERRERALDSLSRPSRTCRTHVERGTEQSAWKSQLLLAPHGTQQYRHSGESKLMGSVALTPKRRRVSSRSCSPGREVSVRHWGLSGSTRRIERLASAVSRRLVSMCFRPGRPTEVSLSRNGSTEIRRSVGIPGERLSTRRPVISTALVRRGVGMVEDPLLLAIGRLEK